MSLNININVENETDLPDDAANMLAMVAHITAIADTMKAMGMSIEEAEQRVGKALRSAWDDSK